MNDLIQELLLITLMMGGRFSCVTSTPHDAVDTFLRRGPAQMDAFTEAEERGYLRYAYEGDKEFYSITPAGVRFAETGKEEE